MDQETPLSWPGQLSEDTLMTVPGNDDFSNFLEFGIDFANISDHAPTERQRPLPDATFTGEELLPVHFGPASQSSQFNHIMTDFPMGFDPHLQGQSHQNQSQDQSQMHPSSYSTSDVASGFAPAQKLPQHQHQRRRSVRQQPPINQSYANGPPLIPPTPNSIEFHGNAARFPQRLDESGDVYDRYSRMNDEQILYTPLVSPAMTPLETQFRFSEYTIPGEYFTPLTSPALEAQNSNSNFYSLQQPRQVSDMGFLQSSSVDSNALPSSPAPTSPGLVRKQRRRPSISTRPVGRAGKPSPSVRPQPRKMSTRNITSNEVLNNLCQENGSSKTQSSTGSSSSLRLGSNEGFSQESISPEPLSEPLMPPPALPQVRRSPAVGPQVRGSQTSGAATPATLMRIQKSERKQDPANQFKGQAELVPDNLYDDAMQDIVLPEPATPATKLPPKPSRIKSSTQIEAPNTGATSGSVTPSAEPNSGSLDRLMPGSIAPSPRTEAAPSPAASISKKPEFKTGNSRNRQSVNSSQASPLLRPKISPSIQPATRGDSVSNESSALYLASKSNYQHILDGTLLPGVSYPENLAENLSSKRTNHKLAEQGRRNRINNALKEIEALLPPGFSSPKIAKEAAAAASSSTPKGSEKEKDKEKNASSMVSKASTVELAIDYIKALKGELAETKDKLEVAESKLKEKDGVVIESGNTSKRGQMGAEAAQAKQDGDGTESNVNGSTNISTEISADPC